MNNLWLRFKIWFKMTLIVALFLYIIFFTYNNASEKTHLWYWFHRQPETNILLLVLFSFAAGVVVSS